MAENERKGGKARKKAVAATVPDKVAFDYIKSNLFRVIHCDGVVGGITPNGLIHLAAWSARQPYPRRVVHEVNPDGSAGLELDRTTRETDVIREIEAGLVFTPDLARAIIKWLQNRLGDLEKFQEAAAALKANADEDLTETVS